MKNIVFYYCTPINDYKKRFNKSFEKIKLSGLYESIDCLILLINGDFLTQNFSHPFHGNCVFFNDNITKFETKDCKIKQIKLEKWKNESKAANYIKSFCEKNEECNVLYLHSKGVTNPESHNVSMWVDFLEYFVIHRYKDCIEKLKTHNTCSANMSLSPSRHYSGNFWWARSSHIRTLDYCDENNYYGCEMWPMSKGDPSTFYNFFSTNKNLYLEPIEKNEYEIIENKKMNSINIDSTNSRTELCELGAKYPTDKSPYNTQCMHRHPYTSIYNLLFSPYKHKEIRLAELGVGDNMSLKCWRAFFEKAKLFGFDNNISFLNRASNENLKYVIYDFVDVKSKISIENSLKKHAPYDIIIEDTTHQIDDQIRTIKIATKYLNVGGILIIEDIFKSINENLYKERMCDIMDYYSTCMFVNADHERRCSDGWDNDKLLIMVRGDKAIEDDRVIVRKSPMFLNIITPCSRPQNLKIIENSINIPKENYRWIVVFDSESIPEIDLPSHCEAYALKDSSSISGNAQRNYALDMVKDGYVLFQDDDTIVHPDLWGSIKDIEDVDFITFCQSDKNGNRRLGVGRVAVGSIDSNNFITNSRMCTKLRFVIDDYSADGIFAEQVFASSKNNLTIQKDLSFYNYLRS